MLRRGEFRRAVELRLLGDMTRVGINAARKAPFQPESSGTAQSSAASRATQSPARDELGPCRLPMRAASWLRSG
jgi:hypothetical protein